MKCLGKDVTRDAQRKFGSQSVPWWGTVAVQVWFPFCSMDVADILELFLRERRNRISLMSITTGII